MDLALPKGTNKVGVSLFSTEDGKLSSFRNVLKYLEYLAINKIQKPSDSEHILPL
jgi:hypothetical protein